MFNNDHNINNKSCFLFLLKRGKSFNQRFSVFVYFFFVLTLSSLSTNTYADTLITNTATANFSINGTAKTLSDSVQLTKNVVVTPTDEITLQKRADVSNAHPGDTITYTLNVGNPNSSTLNNVVIQDTLPPGISFQSGTVTLNNTLINNNKVQLSGNQLSITIGTIPAKSNWTIAYKVKATTVGTHINQAYALSDSANSEKAIATINVTIRPLTLIPLVLNKLANKEKVKPGEIVTYSLSIENPNNAPVSNAVVKDILPSGLSYITNSAKLNFMPISASTTGGLEGLSFVIASIPANTTWQLSYQTQLATNAKVGDLINQARITTDDSNADSNLATNTIQISNFQIGIMKVADKENVVIGDTVTYTVIVDNPENRTLADIVIEDTLPSGFVYIRNSAVIDSLRLSSSSVEINDTQLKFTIGAIAKAGTRSLSYKVKVTADASAGKAINTARAKSENALSTIVSATVKVRTPSTIDFLRIDNNSNGIKSVIPPSSYNDNRNGGKHWQEVNSITLPNGTVIDLPSPQHVVDTEQYSISEPIVIQVTDL
ncbi:MAG TPA: DUF11 domain-containing protein, partial [Leucothrix sp.]|nr:DUF11 domain-containing protein [Leucothrix sp.]